MSNDIVWDDEKPDAGIVWDDAKPKAAPASVLTRTIAGLSDPVVGVAQIADKVLVNPIRQAIFPGASSMQDYSRNREAELTPPEGMDIARMAGNVAQPLNYIGGGVPATLRNRVAQAMTGGAAQGIMSPTTDEDFWQEKAKQAGIGATLGAGVNAVAPAMRAVGNAGAHVLGLTTGAGNESIKQAFKGGDNFVANLRGNVPASDVVEQARSGIQNMRQQMYDAYSTAKGGWADDKTKLDIAPIADAYNNAVGKFSFNGALRPGVESVKADVDAVLRDWTRRAQTNPAFLTVEGLDALKRHLGSVTPADVGNRTGRAFVSEVADAVKSSIIKQRPQYAEAMENYWKSASQLDEIERTLSLGSKSMTDTALRKLQSLTRNNVNTNYGQRSVLAQALAKQGGADVMPAIAGQALNSWTPRGLQALGATGVGGYGLANPASLAALPTMSPRLVGETVRAMGLVGNDVRAQEMMRALRRSMTPAAIAGTRDDPAE
jgi:hypothetical protein